MDDECTDGMQHCQITLQVIFHSADVESGSRFMDDVGVEVFDYILAKIDAHPDMERCADSWENGTEMRASLARKRKREAIDEAALKVGRAAYRRAVEEMTEADEVRLTDDDIQKLLGGDE